MSNAIDNLAKTLQEAMSDRDKRKPSSFDSQATVVAVDGDTLWVQLPGGEERTPVQRTVDASEGDTIMVRVANHKAWAVGNSTSPPTDDTTANYAVRRTQEVHEYAVGVGELAETAESSAIAAQLAAGSAQASADSAKDSADKANTILDGMKVAAEEADTTLTQIYQDAKDAKEQADKAEKAANAAQEDATRANNYANTALDQLGVVENVVGVLNLLAKHGDYQITNDLTVEPEKWYFEKTEGFYKTEDVSVKANKTYYTRSGSGTIEDPYVYAEVSSPRTEDLSQYYEYMRSYNVLLPQPTEIGYTLASPIYILTTDVELVEGKTYYTRSGSGTVIDPYVYTVVENPDVSEISTYYETALDPDKIYYTRSGHEIIYISTEDVAVVSGKTYYTRSGGEIVYTLTQDEEIVEGKTYYTRSGSGGLVYTLTEDTEIVAGKTYYTRSGGETVYALTQDEEIVEGKTYYTRSGTGTSEDPYIYTAVETPDVSEISTYYEASVTPYVYTAVEYPDAEYLYMYYEATDDPYMYTAVDEPDISEISTYYEATVTPYVYTAVDDPVDSEIESYFELVVTPYVYTPVASPDISEIGTYYEGTFYELVGIEDAIQNYVSSQLALTDDGLWLRTSGMDTKVLLSSEDGVVLYGPTGNVIGKYGETAQIGDAEGFHIKISGTELGFYQGPAKIAYLSNEQLYITKSVVIEQMDVGNPVSKGGLGQWSWAVHANGQSPSRNNLYLKWRG